MATPTQAASEAIQLVGRRPPSANVFKDQDMKNLIDSCDAPKQPYTVVSIIGPQSGGKSTLLNCIFNTKFGVMDDTITREQTTQGIWAAICNSPRAVVLDIEGTDSLELLQNDLGFENRSALFALVISDVIFVNMWLHNIGLVNGVPLLTNIFQERAKKADPEKGLPEQHRTTIIFAVRDYDGRTPKNALEEKLISMVHEIWKTIPQTEDMQLQKYFELHVELFPNLVFEENKFYTKCAEMKSYIESVDWVGRRLFQLPVCEFPSDAKELWEKIMKNQTLDLPSQREVRARSSCDLIVSDILRHFKSQNKEYFEDIYHGKEKPREFDNQLKQMVDDVLSMYNNEACVYGKDIAVEMEKKMLTDILEFAQPAFKIVMEKFQTEIIEKATNEIRLTEGKDGLEETYAHSVVSRFNEEFKRETKGLNYYIHPTDHENFMNKLEAHCKNLASDIKAINKHKTALGIAGVVLTGVAAATGGAGAAAAAAGYALFSAAAALAGAATAAAAAGVEAARMHGPRKDVKKAVNRRKLEISEVHSDENENTGALSSSSSSK